jgi:hypothetical protein
MKTSALEEALYAAGLAAAGAAVLFLWAIKWGPESFVQWWTSGGYEVSR